jgi:hypothetical protein
MQPCPCLTGRISISAGGGIPFWEEESHHVKPPCGSSLVRMERNPSVWNGNPSDFVRYLSLRRYAPRKFP